VTATLEERLARIEQGDAELRTYFVNAVKDDPTLYVSDLVIFGALKRTLSLSDGFRRHIRERNFTCAGALLRLQLDTALRLYGAKLHGNLEAYADAIVKGGRIDKLRDSRGHRLTDSYLADKLSEEFPWVKRMYENLCDFIHFSNRHLFAAAMQAGDRTFHLAIGAQDPLREERDYYEAVEAFYESMRVTIASLRVGEGPATLQANASYL
jgi:hypothetical protein